MSGPRLSIVVPCYNEEEVLPSSAENLGALLRDLQSKGMVSDASRILFVDDGSRDKTWDTIKALAQNDRIYSGLKLSNNRGHQIALLAGLESEKESDYVVSIDADLQDDPQVIREMLLKANEGYEIIYGVRSDRESDSFFKRFTAASFYKLMTWLGAKVIHHHADFRMLSTRVLDALSGYQEVNLFLRGIFPVIGFRSTTCHYKRSARSAGETKYPFRKMVAFAIEGITSSSIRPLRLVTYIGFSSLIVTGALSLWTLYTYLQGHTVAGWASTMISIYFIASVQLLCLGVIGEYVGKIYQESKARPRYHIDEFVGH